VTATVEWPKVKDLLSGAPLPPSREPLSPEIVPLSDIRISRTAYQIPVTHSPDPPAKTPVAPQPGRPPATGPLPLKGEAVPRQKAAQTEPPVIRQPETPAPQRASVPATAPPPRPQDLTDAGVASVAPDRPHPESAAGDAPTAAPAEEAAGPPSFPALPLPLAPPPKSTLAQAVARSGAARQRPLPRSQPARPFVPVTARQAVGHLSAQGWRFKRKDGEKSASAPTVARTVRQLVQKKESGKPLAPTPRAIMESTLQRDFSAVRVHTAPLAPLNIQAATKAGDVYVEPGHERFDTPRSLALLGHELTHVSQQGFAGSVSHPATMSPPVQRQARVAREEAEAESAEKEIMRVVAPTARPPGSPAMPLTYPAGMTQVARKAGPEPGALPSRSEPLAAAVRRLYRPDAPQLPLLAKASPSLTGRQPAQTVQRATELPGVESQAEVPAPDSGEASEQKQPDLKKLARQVYPLLRWRLLSELQRLSR
jgi:hypothetical protein